MQAPGGRKRKSADPQPGRCVKASITVDAALHARWSAAASLGGMDRNAFAVEALRKALEGILIIDRRKASDRVKIEDRPDPALKISPDGEEAA